MSFERVPSKAITHQSSKKGSIWDSPLYYLRSPLFYWLLLSLLSLKPHPCTWIRWVLSANRHSPSKTSRSTAPQHFRATSLWRVYYLSPPKPYGRKSQARTPSPLYYNRHRCIFYTPTSLRVLWSSSYNFRWSIRINFLQGHRIPLTACNHWVYFPYYLFPTPIKIPLHIQPPLRLWSHCLILAFCRCCTTIPLHIYLLMRLIILLVLISTTDF